jgi:hypothetical protein
VRVAPGALTSSNIKNAGPGVVGNGIEHLGQLGIRHKVGRLDHDAAVVEMM